MNYILTYLGNTHISNNEKGFSGVLRFEKTIILLLDLSQESNSFV